MKRTAWKFSSVVMIILSIIAIVDSILSFQIINIWDTFRNVWVIILSTLSVLFFAIILLEIYSGKLSMPPEEFD